MNTKNIIGFLILFTALSILPLFARADTLAEMLQNGILPQCTGGGEGIVNLCTICDAWHLGDNIITFLLFGLAIPVITISLLWGGVLWVTARGDSSQITHGKNIMTTSLIGIVIAMSGWLVVDTILKTLASGKDWVGAWNKFPKCEIVKGSPMPTAGQPPQIPPKQLPADQAAAQVKEPAIRMALRDVDIVINNPSCDEKHGDYATTKSGCTNVGGLRVVTVNEAIDMSIRMKKIGETIVITGGSEINGHTCKPGAASHCSGNKIDLRMSPKLDQYIKDNFTRIGDRSDGSPQYQKPGTEIIYADESKISGTDPHWDVKVP